MIPNFSPEGKFDNIAKGLRMRKHRHGTNHSERTGSDRLHPVARLRGRLAARLWAEGSVGPQSPWCWCTPCHSRFFVGTVGTPRADLVQDIAFVVAIAAAIVCFYSLVFLLFYFVFRFSLGESVLAALTASSPDVPFMGPPSRSVSCTVLLADYCCDA